MRIVFRSRGGEFVDSGTDFRRIRVIQRDKTIPPSMNKRCTELIPDTDAQ